MLARTHGTTLGSNGRRDTETGATAIGAPPPWCSTYLGKKAWLAYRQRYIPKVVVWWWWDVCVCVFCWNVHALWLRSFSLFSSSSSRHHFSDPHGQRFSPSHTHTPLFSSSKFALGYTCNDYRNLILYLEKGNERKGK